MSVELPGVPRECQKTAGKKRRNIEGVEEMAPQLDVVVAGKKISCPGASVLLGAVPNIRKGAEIRLPDQRHAEALQVVVGYLSEGGKMDGVGLHNAAEILDCARLLGLGSVKDACEESLVQRLSTTNCIQLRRFASQHSLPLLTRRCDQLLSDAFATILAEPGSLELPRIQVRLDVSSQLLELGTDLMDKVVPKIVSVLDAMRSNRRHLEEAVVQLVLRPDFRVSELTKDARDSIRHSPLSPERHTPNFYTKLLSGSSPVRQLILSPKKAGKGEPCPHGMQLLATTKLSDVAMVCLVEDQTSFLLIAISLSTILQNGKFPASPTTGLPTFSLTSNCFISQMNQARSGFGMVTTESEVLAVGGFNRSGCLDSVECYNSITNSWKGMERMKTKRGRLCTVCVEDQVYAIGGSDGKQELSTVERLDVKQGKWQRVGKSMPTPRSCLGTAVLDGVVFAVGGEHYSVPLKTAEAFHPSTETWQPLPPLGTPRSDLAVVACAGKVYAIGGKTRSVKCLSSVESYDPVTKSWSTVASMKCARRNAAAVTVGDKVMVIGGYSGTAALRSVEIYDPECDQWQDCPSLCSVRSHASAGLYNGQVYVVGGFTGSIFLNTVETFDLRTEKWTPFS